MDTETPPAPAPVGETPPPAVVEVPPPSIAEPGKWMVYHAKRDFPVMLKKTPLGFVVLLAGSLFLGWLFTWHVAVPEFTLQLGTKQGQIDALKDQRDHAEEQVKDLKKDIESLKVYRGKDAPPLKRKALILVNQIRDFLSKWKGPQQDDQQFIDHYHQRFVQRVTFIRDDLDQNNQQSDLLDKTLHDWDVYNRIGVDQVKTIADEIEKLANKLND